MQHKISISLPVGFGHYYGHKHMNDKCEIYVREYRSPWSYDQRYQHYEYLLFLTICPMVSPLFLFMYCKIIWRLWFTRIRCQKSPRDIKRLCCYYVLLEFMGLKHIIWIISSTKGIFLSHYCYTSSFNGNINIRLKYDVQ